MTRQKPHSSVRYSNTRIEDNATAINPALPPSGSKAKTSTRDPAAGSLRPDGDFDVNRGAAMTGNDVPKDRTNINGYVPGVK